VDLKNIELARPGVWQLASGRTTFTVEHLRDAADFYQATGRQKLGIGLGHNDPRFTGDPSFGNITNVRYEEDARGPVLKGDVVDMPGWLHAAAPSRWPNRSIEGYEDFEYDGRKYRLVLTGLALLGATPPGVQNIRSLQDLQLALAASAARRIVASAPVEEREHVLDDDGLECVTCLREVAAAADTNPVDDNQLKNYWLHEEGAAKWSTWTELYHHLLKHMSAGMAKRVAAQWFHERYGIWPGADLNRVKHGKPPRGEQVGPG
jgi:hypothetical protein